jgi:ZIP family zinc transporter
MAFSLQAFLMGLLTFFITVLGSSLVFLFKKINDLTEKIMLGISAGIMMAASIWSLLDPAIESASKLHMIPWLVISIGFILGVLFLLISDYLMNNNHSKTLLLSITLHNIPEGLAIGLAFGSLAFNYTPTLLTSAYVLAIGIGIQNFPEGCAISLPLKNSGYSASKAFILGSLSAIVEPIFAFLGAILVLKVVNIMPLLLSFAAGAMMYVVVKELIPQSQNDEGNSLISFFTLLGFVIMMILDIALG